MNLFLNAAQAFRDARTDEIAAEREDDSLKILVADNGPGIPEEYFRAFSVPNVSTKSGSTRRSGLGFTSWPLS